MKAIFSLGHWLVPLLALAAASSAVESLTLQPWTLPAYASPTDTPYTVETSKDVVYGKGYTATGDMDLKLDVYQPKGLSLVTSKAAILLVHGGSFATGSRADMEMFCRPFAHKGMVAFSMDYRMMGDVPPVQLPTYITGLSIFQALPNVPQIMAAEAAYIDFKAALRYIHANAAKYGIDTANIFVGGASAGAITALSSATSSRSYIADSLGQPVRPENTPGASMSVRGVVDWSGGMYFDLWQLDAKDAPIMIYHGDDDTVVPYKYATDLKAHCDSIGLECEMHIVPNGGHVPFAGAPAGDVLSVATSFVMRHILNPGTAVKPSEVTAAPVRWARSNDQQIEIQNLSEPVVAAEIWGTDGRRQARLEVATGARSLRLPVAGGVRVLRMVSQSGRVTSLLVPLQ